MILVIGCCWLHFDLGQSQSSSSSSGSSIYFESSSGSGSFSFGSFGSSGSGSYANESYTNVITVPPTAAPMSTLYPSMLEDAGDSDIVWTSQCNDKCSESCVLYYPDSVCTDADAANAGKCYEMTMADPFGEGTKNFSYQCLDHLTLVDDSDFWVLVVNPVPNPTNYTYAPIKSIRGLEIPDTIVELQITGDSSDVSKGEMVPLSIESPMFQGETNVGGLYLFNLKLSNNLEEPNTLPTNLVQPYFINLGLEHVPVDVANMTSLTTLNITSNELTSFPGPGDLVYPGLKDLRILSIMNNNLTSFNTELASLVVLELADNPGLNGIPECVFEMSNLRYLNARNTGYNASSNNLTDAQQQFLDNLEYFTY